MRAILVALTALTLACGGMPAEPDPALVEACLDVPNTIEPTETATAARPPSEAAWTEYCALIAPDTTLDELHETYRWFDVD